VRMNWDRATGRYSEPTAEQSYRNRKGGDE